MTIEAPSVKKRKRGMPSGKTSTHNSLVADGVANYTQANIPTRGSANPGNNLIKVPSTKESSSTNMPIGGCVERNSKGSIRGLLPVKHKQGIGTSYAQPAVSPGQILLEKERQEKPHRIQVFSSQNLPQPFLNK